MKKKLFIIISTFVFAMISLFIININASAMEQGDEEYNNYQQSALEEFANNNESDYYANLLNLDDIEETTENGITYSIKDNIFYINGTATSDVNMPFTFNNCSDLFFGYTNGSSDLMYVFYSDMQPSNSLSFHYIYSSYNFAFNYNNESSGNSDLSFDYQSEQCGYYFDTCYPNSFNTLKSVDKSGNVSYIKISSGSSFENFTFSVRLFVFRALAKQYMNEDEYFVDYGIVNESLKSKLDEAYNYGYNCGFDYNDLNLYFQSYYMLLCDSENYEIKYTSNYIRDLFYKWFVNGYLKGKELRLSETSYSQEDVTNSYNDGYSVGISKGETNILENLNEYELYTKEQYNGNYDLGFDDGVDSVPTSSNTNFSIGKLISLVSLIIFAYGIYKIFIYSRGKKNGIFKKI